MQVTRGTICDRVMRQAWKHSAYLPLLLLISCFSISRTTARSLNDAGTLNLQGGRRARRENADVARYYRTHEGMASFGQPQISTVCLYSERNSGSTWLGGLIEANFELGSIAGWHQDCPHKHDYSMNDPNEFLILPADTLVIVNVRNAFDWAPSMHRTPWGARAHCNASWEDFLRAEWSPGILPEELPAGAYELTPSHFQMTPDQNVAVYGNASCPKYDMPYNRHPVIYERQDSRYARNILELRAWKAQRAIQLLQIRKQSTFVRHEDLLVDQEAWLVWLRDHYGLNPKPGFPNKVLAYRAVLEQGTYVPHSELATMQEGTGQSEYWDSASIRLLRDSLDLDLEAALGYSYDGIFSRWLADDQ